MTAVKILRYFLAAACFIMAGLSFYAAKQKRDIDIQLAEGSKRILREKLDPIINTPECTE